MSDFYRIASLFRKFRTHAIQEDEVRELWEWMKAEENREFFKQMMDGEREVNVIQELKKYDREAAFRKFAGRTHLRKRRLMYYMRVAAVIALPIILGVLLYWWVDTPMQENISETLSPGQKKAILTLDDGTKMALGNVVNEEIIGCEGGGLRIDSTGLRYDGEKREETMRMNELYVLRKGEYALTLSDGTRVFLNSDSKLVYPVAFGNECREVILQGEAYFEVVKDEKCPFIVKTSDLSVQVLGTAFNLSCYPDDLRVETTLVRGSVKVEEGKNEILLEPGEQACFDRGSGKMDKLKVNPVLFTSWKDGLFVFERERLEDMLIILSRWYDVVVFYKREDVKDELFTGDLKKYNSIEEHLKMLEMTTDVQFEIRGNTIIVK